jgi:hypothetical protein
MELMLANAEVYALHFYRARVQLEIPALWTVVHNIMTTLICEKTLTFGDYKPIGVLC